MIQLDTPGEEQFRGGFAKESSEFHDVDGYIVVYDVADMTSFNNVKHWLDWIGR